jgi:hypothetical protein
MLGMRCSTCGRTITAPEVGGLVAGVRRHVETVCAGASEVSAAFLEAVRRLRGDAVAASA